VAVFNGIISRSETVGNCFTETGLFIILFDQQSEYKVFYKLMGWLAIYRVDILA